MKRLTAIICVIVLCLSTALSLASTEIKDDISFRNIPWESSIDEVLATLKKEFVLTNLYALVPFDASDVRF